MSLFGYSTQQLADLKATMTATEIAQQPSSWKRALANLDAVSDQVKSFLSGVAAKPGFRVILTGAGTSAFVGRALKPYLHALTGYEVLEVATTDLVSNPQEYLSKDVPTLLVSFGRSGNSPESVAAYNLVNQCLSQAFHLVVTCNAEGELARRSVGKDNSLVLLMPPETNDGSFAMTSSYSSMMLSTLAAFTLDKGTATEQYAWVADATEKNFAKFDAFAKSLVDNKLERLIYLGSGGLQGLSQEAGLKMLELTAGDLMATHDSPLGFRHGPKSMVNAETLVVEFFSNHPYTRLYDTDLLNELRRDKKAKRVVAVSAKNDAVVSDQPENALYVEGFEQAQDYHLVFPYACFAQLYALHSSISRGHTPDNPCPTGEVNRVVQGVIVHPYNK